jgi:hypothetical protein
MTPRSASRAVLLSTLAALAAVPAGAFPGSVRWGYANCVTCHVNVAGGGVLTPYGRLLSRELLSTTSSGEHEPEFAYGSAWLPAWLQLGGDLTYTATGDHPMQLVQADLEAAAHRGRLLAVATVGRMGDEDRPVGHEWVSRRHYLELSATRFLSVRAGRFLPNFGVWNGDASVATRAGLGWDHDTYNVEANWVADRFNVAVTGIVAGTAGGVAERGVSASAGAFFSGKRKVWLSYVARGRPGLSRRAGGLASVVGIGSHAYLLMQGDLQRLERDGAPARSELFANACLARETFKGLYVLLVDEVARRGSDGPARVSHSYGAGLRFFPRPHFETHLRWRQRDRDAVSREMDGVSLFVHFYP